MKEMTEDGHHAELPLAHQLAGAAAEAPAVQAAHLAVALLEALADHLGTHRETLLTIRTNREKATRTKISPTGRRPQATRLTTHPTMMTTTTMMMTMTPNQNLQTTLKNPKRRRMMRRTMLHPMLRLL
jgi:hypothetical protein